MGRLIDADALAAEVSAWKRQQHSMNIDYSTGYRSALSTVGGMIAEAPTIDAIPVEWMKEKTRHPDNHTQASAKWMLGCWKREQEENNEHV